MNQWDGDEFEDEGPQDVDLEEFGGDRDDSDTVPCPTCGRDIYEGAERCPHCDQYVVGGGESERTWGWKNLLWALIGAGVLILLLYLTC